MKEEILVKANEGKPNEVSTTIKIEIPDTLEDMAKVWGKELIYTKLKQKAHIDAVNCARTMLVAGKKPNEVTDAMATWKPGVAGPRKSPVDKATAAIANMTVEQKQQMLAKLRELLQPAGKK
jgi:predicted outer membrane protein